MIQDIDGSTPEPARRRYFAVLSTVISSVSLALLVALVVPAPRVALSPPAASPAASASAGPAVTRTIISNPIRRMRVDLTSASLCADGTRLIPPYYLAFEAGTGRVFAVGSDLSASRSFPVAFRFDARTGWMTVLCATSDPFAPWDDFAR